MLRRAATTLALLAVLLPAGAAAGPAGAADLRSEVERTARELTEGTRRLEQGQAELVVVQRKLVTARREASEAIATSAGARERLRTVVRAAYRRPLADGMVLALSAEDFGQAVAAQADLARVRGRQQDLLREASAGRVRAAGAVRSVEQLTDEAARRARDLAAQTRALRAAAGQAATRLQAVTEAAAAAARDRARGRPRVMATCTGTGGGDANGFLDAASLCGLAGGSGALRADAATSFARMTEAHRVDRGSGLCVTDSYRPYAAQVSVFRRTPRLAAVPGTSRHGWGLALDLGCGVQRFGSASYRWMKSNAGRYGWVHPSWAEPGVGAARYVAVRGSSLRTGPHPCSCSPPPWSTSEARTARCARRCSWPAGTTAASCRSAMRRATTGSAG